MLYAKINVFNKKINNIYSSKKKILIKPSHLGVQLKNFLFNYINIMFIRKFKIFNKGRYSRTRQLYRTGVYWCLFLNVLLVVALYFWFYRFTMNFGYEWWFFTIFISSLFISRSLNNLFYIIIYSTYSTYIYIFTTFLNFIKKYSFKLYNLI